MPTKTTDDPTTDEKQGTVKETSTKSRPVKRDDEVYSGRPTTVRFTVELQRRLEVAADIAQLSVSQLLRDAAEMIIDKYMGDDPEGTIVEAAERSAERMRELFGLADTGDNSTSNEPT